MHPHEIELNVATLLLQYEIQLFELYNITVKDKNDVVHKLNHDPIFRTTVHSIISLLNQKDNTVDIYQHLTCEKNLQVLDDMSIAFIFNEKAKVALIRDGRNSIDFYPTTNKWKDNNDEGKMHHGNAHLLLKNGMNF